MERIKNIGINKNQRVIEIALVFDKTVINGAMDDGDNPLAVATELRRLADKAESMVDDRLVCLKDAIRYTENQASALQAQYRQLTGKDYYYSR